MRTTVFAQVRVGVVLCITMLFVSHCYAQFSSTVQGVVEDPSGAGIPKADVHIESLATQVTRATTSDGSGNFRFLSLAPGRYKLTVESSGFGKSEVDITL